VILRQLPDLPPRPETPRNAAFRRDFYSRWGKENCIVSGKSRHAEYSRFRQTLSIKAILNGSEHYYLDRRRLCVTDETYLILNEGREYASVLEAPQDATSFCIFFRPGMAGEVAGSSRMDTAQALEAGPNPERRPAEFAEHLRRHDKSVSPVLHYIRHHVQLGLDDAGWYEEQFEYLLARMLRSESDVSRLPERVDCIGSAKRRELVRRLCWSTDYMHSNLHKELSLTDIARAAHLSNYHYLRLFRQVYQMTPMTYLRVQRTQRALALLNSTSLGIQEIADQVGFSRLSLWRNVKRMIGEGPLRMRQRQAGEEMHTDVPVTEAG
jgi:AraC family transcriptional regulator